MQWPDFIGIGGQRCGSTSFYQYLIQHPRIDDNDFQKECHYFDHRYIQEKGPNWYRSMFRPRTEHLSGEMTPTYIWHPHARQRIHRHTPNSGFFVLLRNPVDRAYSQYHRSRKRLNAIADGPFNKIIGELLGLSFPEAMEYEDEHVPGWIQELEDDPLKEQELLYLVNFKLRGRYVEQLEAWFELFPRDQFYIIQSEKLFEDTVRVVSKAFEWLGLEPYQIEQPNRYEHHGYPPIDPDVREQLVEYFRPYNERLYELLGRDFGWE